MAALSACNEWCEARAAQCGDVDSCMDHCLERASYLAPCESEYEEVLLCGAAHPPLDPLDCNKPVASCDAERDTLLGCVYPAGPCEPGECFAGQAGAPAMECNFVCGGVVYTSACGQGGVKSDFPMDCSCQIDGEPVGTCQSVTVNGVTSLGCCSAYFAESQ